VFVGKEYGDLSLGCIGVVLVFALAIGLVNLIPPVKSDSATQSFGVGVVAAGLFFWRFWAIAKTRCWLTATDSGFILTNFRGKHCIADDDVTDIGITERIVSSQRMSSTHRTVRFSFRSGDRVDTLAFDQHLKSSQPDQLGHALQRALKNRCRRVREDIERGETLSGDGWMLTRAMLTVQTGEASREILLTELKAIDWVDGAVCVWANGEVETVLRVEGTQPGATVLFHVLGELRVSSPVAESTTESADKTAVRTVYAPVSEGGVGLGRLLFSRDKRLTNQQRRSFRRLAIIAGIFGSIWTVAGFATENNKLAPIAQLFGPATLLACVIYIWACVRRGPELLCYENGIVYVTRRATTELLYRDMVSFTYSATRLLVNGVEAGTTVQLVFESSDGRRRISYHLELSPYQDDAIERLREHISSIIAGSMARSLREGQPVKWTGQLAFTAEGLAIVREGSSGKGRVVPYNEVTHHEFKEGAFFLHSKTDFGRPIKERVSQPNFFPGYHLLLLLTTPTDKEAPQTNSDPDSLPEDR
jgi:hypothetical protein